MSKSSLTERYVHEVIRRLPAEQRGDIAEELRVTIADMVEARGASDPSTAEREVLVEMGDPVPLALRFADRPLVLIGPELYPRYLRLTKLLLTTVLPLVVVLFVALDVVDGKSLRQLVLTAVMVTVTAAAQMIAWPTVAFAVAQRTRYRNETVVGGGTWTPEDLPDEVPDPHQTDRSGYFAFGSAMWSALLLGVIVWQHIAMPYRLHGADGSVRRMEVLEPSLWNGWIWPVVIGLGILVALDLIRVAAGNWTPLRAGWYALGHALFALPLAWILYRHMLFDPIVLDDFNGSLHTPDAFYTLTGAVVLLSSGHEVFRRFRDARHP
ncbi:HAAS signaling domain-containing protein [Nocardia colli]|uniref:HAAS signaling domain-containing protein n=1 Tax=Nocardia colli TaxID=2545717 RepID=UPI0035E2A630